VRHEELIVLAGDPVTVPLQGQGPRVDRELGMHTIAGWHRSDGTLLTASVPAPSGKYLPSPTEAG
jgi:alpha,alpha-trehalose phosphorylase